MPVLPPALVALALLVLGGVVRYVVLRGRSDVSKLPGPSKTEAHWFWGHELIAHERGTIPAWTEWARTFGGVYKVTGALFHGDMIIATDHAAVQHVFQDVDTFVKAAQIREVTKKILGHGIVTHEHDGARRQRRLVAPAFSVESVKGMTDDVAECAERLESRLTNQVLSHDGGVTINIADDMSTTTLDIIGRVAFGHDFRSGASPEAQEIRRSWDGQVQVACTFPVFVSQLVLRACPWIARLPLPIMKEAMRTHEIVSGLAMRLLRRGYFNEKGRDILSILVRANRAEGAKDTLSDQELIDNIVTFMLVGHDTTAGSLAFTLLELARHPDVQTQLREELRDAPRALTYEDVHKLPFLDAVIKEGLRVHPASPATERVAAKDSAIPLSKPVRTADGKTLTALNIRAGQVIHVPFPTMNTNPDVWGADAAAFRPARWLDGGVPAPAALPHGWSGLTTFCDGPRNCIGYRLAVLEMKVIIATLVRGLEFHETTAEVRENPKPTLQAVTDGTVGLLPLHVTLAA